MYMAYVSVLSLPSPPPLSLRLTQALKFAVDQAPFACEAASTHPATNAAAASGTVAAQEGAAAAAAAAATVANSDTSRVRLAVRAGLQFACNYCVGSEENKAMLWDAWFPRRLMVRTSDRPLCRSI